VGALMLDGSSGVVCLRGRPLGPGGAAALATLLETVALRELDLAGCAITAAGLAALAPVLARQPGLERLDLRGNRLGDDGLATLAGALAGCPRLAALRVGDNDAGAPGLDALWRAVQASTTLVHLDLARPEAVALLCRNRNRAPRTPSAVAAPPPPEAPAGDLRLDALRADGPLDGELRRLVIDAARRIAREERERHTRPAPPPIERGPSRPGAPRAVDSAGDRDDPAWEAEDRAAGFCCYCCRRTATTPHPRYPRMCPDCGELSWSKRNETADLTGKVALVTGARIKSGFQVGLRLLRAGATVIATSRFARDAVARYAAEPDFDAWSERLSVVRLDLLDLAATERLADHLAASSARLDVLVHNAAQTIFRPPAFYRELLAAERLPPGLPAPVRSVQAEPAAAAVTAVDDQVNSWVLRLHQVSTVEAVTTHLINVIGPLILTSRLRGLMARDRDAAKHIVNVSAVEGQFYRANKSALHPHTNMAKAALNMMTRTSAADYAGDGIYMNSVDPGWFSNDAPLPLRQSMAARGFTIPLDDVDAAARICDPVFLAARRGITFHGLLLKDFRPVHW
jgi:NAD(P)-dependent dehydrogenase (short-subunit alcohol dehydrogenase family)